MNNDISIMIGRTLVEIKKMCVGSDQIEFIDSGGSKYILYHDQSCCEIVCVEDVTGYSKDLIGVPLLMSEEVGVNSANYSGCSDSHTWTFYKFATVKGYVTIRWLGESNGYYSESVNFRMELSENEKMIKDIIE